MSIGSHKEQSVVGDVPGGIEPHDSESMDLVDVILNGPDQQHIAVIGEWGTGKTSLMRAAKEALDTPKRKNGKKPQAFTVWFNAWRYEREENLVIPLLGTIETALPDTAPQQVKGRVRRLLLAVARASSIHAYFAEISGKEMVDSYLEGSPDQGSPYATTSLYFGFVQEMERIVAELKKPLVIFVDDLDRCLPAAAFRLVEQIKLFFDLPGVIVVFGASLDALRDAVRDHYKDAAEPLRDERAIQYIEKLLQHRFPVPPVRVQGLVDAYAWDVQCGLLVNWAKRVRSRYVGRGAYSDLLRHALARYITSQRATTPRAAKRWLEQLDQYLHRFRSNQEAFEALLALPVARGLSGDLEEAWSLGEDEFEITRRAFQSRRLTGSDVEVVKRNRALGLIASKLKAERERSQPGQLTLQERESAAMFLPPGPEFNLDGTRHAGRNGGAPASAPADEPSSPS